MMLMITDGDVWGCGGAGEEIKGIVSRRAGR
jgi:hypothetical protein